jgi:hypothetical protein
MGFNSALKGLMLKAVKKYSLDLVNEKSQE